MQLIGYMDSPFVRRVAVSAGFLQVVFEHRELSIFRDLDAFRAINPLLKAPTLICDDGTSLTDSSLIIEHLESVSGKTLLPKPESARQRTRHIIGTALVAMEKVVQIIYETKQRPAELQHQPWIERITGQLAAATAILEDAVGDGTNWYFGNEISQADISTAVAWRFVQHIVPEQFALNNYLGLVAHSERAERLAEFRNCPVT